MRWPLGSNHHAGSGSRYPEIPGGLWNLEREASNPLSGSVRFVTNLVYSHVRGGLVDKMISKLFQTEGLARKPRNAPSCLHLIPPVEGTTACPAWLPARPWVLGLAKRLNLHTWGW